MTEEADLDQLYPRLIAASLGLLCVLVTVVTIPYIGGAAQPANESFNTSTFDLEWQQPMAYENTKIVVEDVDNDGGAEIAVGDYTYSEQSRYGILASNGSWYWQRESSEVVWPKTVGNVTPGPHEQFMFKQKDWSGSNAQGNWIRPYSVNGSYYWSDGLADLTDGVKTTDYDDDGLTEVVATSNLQGYLKVWQDTGELVWRLHSPKHVEIPYGFADANQDGHPEILTNVGNAATWRNKGLQLITPDGQNGVERLWSYGEGNIIRPRFAQLDGDEKLEVFAVFQENGTVQSLDTNGSELWRTETPTTNAEGDIAEIVGDDTADLIVQGKSNISVVDGSTQSVETIRIGNKTHGVELYGDTIAYRTASEFGLATFDQGVVVNWTLDTNTTELAVGNVTDATGAEIVLAKKDAVQVYAVSEYEDLLPTDLRSQSGQALDRSKSPSQNGSAGIPVLSRFSDSSESLGIGIIVLLGSVGGYVGYRKLNSSDSAEQSEDRQYE